MTNSEFYEELYHKAHSLGVMPELRKRVEKRFRDSEERWDVTTAVNFTQEELDKIIRETKITID